MEKGGKYMAAAGPIDRLLVQVSQRLLDRRRAVSTGWQDIEVVEEGNSRQQGSTGATTTSATTTAATVLLQ